MGAARRSDGLISTTGEKRQAARTFRPRAAVVRVIDSFSFERSEKGGPPVVIELR
jgi:hypothetical protein